jgi:hypothetical protein
MGLEAHSFRKLCEIVKHYDNPRVLSLGIPEIFVPEGELPQELAVTDTDTIRRHGGQVPYDGVRVLRDHMGLKVVFLEMKPDVNVDMVHDLNYPLYEGLEKESFEVIIDPGTFEHIFNIGTVFRSMKKVLTLYGRILHTNPINRVNHGFWSLSPTAYKDFYEANGYEIEEMSLWGGYYATPGVADIINTPYERFPIKGEGSVCVVAHKKTEELSTVWPIQWKYR